jgi:hypothetical protein
MSRKASFCGAATAVAGTTKGATTAMSSAHRSLGDSMAMLLERPEKPQTKPAAL